MPSFRRKPVVIEARKLTFENQEEIKAWCGGTTWSRPPMREVTGISIKTLEGMMDAEFGDWIIQGVKGEFYPCKPDIFELTYEKDQVVLSEIEKYAIEREVAILAALEELSHRPDVGVEYWHYDPLTQAKPIVVEPRQVQGIFKAIREHAKTMLPWAKKAIESHYEACGLRDRLESSEAARDAAMEELAALRTRAEAAEAVVVAARAAYRCDGGHKYAEAEYRAFLRRTAPAKEANDG